MKGLLSGLIVASSVLCTVSAVAADAPHYFYIEKVGTSPWFIEEVAGAQAEAERLGAKFSNQDVKADANLAITAVDNAVASGAAGIVIVVPDQQIGPAVLAKAKEAKMPVIAVDDSIKDADGKGAPFVGFSAIEVGKQVGNAIADMHVARGWGDKIEPDTKLLSAEIQSVSVCMDRTDNAIAVLKDRLGLKDEQILHVAIDPGTQDVALANVAQAITAFPGVKKWLIASCGDEGVLGSVRSMEQAGYASDGLIGVGINGQLGCEEFKKADATGFRGSIAVASKIHGETAIRLLNDFVTKGIPIPARTIVAGNLITRDDNGAYCGH